MPTLLFFPPELTQIGAAPFASLAPEAFRTSQPKPGFAGRERVVWVGRRRHVAPPAAAEVARMVAEFHARGGQVTQCAPAHALPVNNGAGSEAAHWTA